MNLVFRITLCVLCLVFLQGSYQQPIREIPKCVIDTVWWEARGESLKGQLAVAHTIFNRVEDPRFKDTPCEVVQRPYQFKYSPVNPNTEGYKDFSETLKKHLSKNTHDSIQVKNRIGKSLYFISKKNLDRLPHWYYKKEVTATIEGHTFLK